MNLFILILTAALWFWLGRRYERFRVQDFVVRFYQTRNWTEFDKTPQWTTRDEACFLGGIARGDYRDKMEVDNGK